MALTQIDANAIQPGVITQDLFSETVSFGPTIPLITTIDYPGDDTAADPAGGQTIIIRGSNFTAQSSVYLAGNPVSPLAFVNSSALSFTAPAQTTGVYSLYVVNDNGATAIAVPGLLYSGTPTWTTSAGSLGSVYETSNVNVNLQATGDGNVTFAASASNTIPTGLTLNSNGLLTGTVPATDPTTTYTFSVDAIDEQNQETARSFSITFLKDEVIWASPANGASYSLGTGVSNTVPLEANSASGKSITYSLQSGSLPANVSISGSNITGTPDAEQTNTSVVIRATAADTLRFADRTLWFTVAPGLVTITNATYLREFSVGGSERIRDIKFSPNGVYMFVSIESGDIRRYSLSTPWDISSASYDQVLNTGTYGDVNTTGFCFSPNGLYLYFIGYGLYRIKRLDLSNAWNISSGITDWNNYYSTGDSSARGLFINETGTRIFLALEGNAVQQYNMSTAFDINTATPNSSFSMVSGSLGSGIAFTNEGKKAFTVGLVDDKVHEYTLGTPYELSTASYAANVNITSYASVPRSLAFSNTGTYMYVVNGNPSSGIQNSVKQFTL